jgi:hypothetical protein
VEHAIRLSGPLRGVAFHGDGPPRRSPYDILDCRLALALDDFAGILTRYGITRVKHMSMYRPPSPGALSRKHSFHNEGLAIDVGGFARPDGAKLVVEKDWHGAIGDPTCGPEANPRQLTSEALALRGVLCSVVRARLFHLVLTPNYDKRHKDHFHLEVRRRSSWFHVN